MFDWGGSEKRLRDVTVLAAALPAALGEMHPVERAAILMLANMSLSLAARLHAPLMDSKPETVDIKAAHAALREILPVAEMISYGVIDKSLPRMRQSRCYQRALELAAVTIGLAISPSDRGKVTAAWKTVWADRERRRDALTWLRAWEATTGAPAFPPGQSGDTPSDIEALAATTRVPAFLTRGRPSR